MEIPPSPNIYNGGFLMKANWVSVEQFLDRISDKKNTKNNYRTSLKDYFECLKVEPEHYFIPDRDYENDIWNFIKCLRKKCGRSGNPLTHATIGSKLGAVRSFLVENEIELPKRFWKKISRKTNKGAATTIDRVPSTAELRAILSHMSSNARTFFLTLVSSGARVDELLCIELDDIDLNSEPAKLTFRAEYTKNSTTRISFISTEAKEAVTEWLKYRDIYLKQAIWKCRNNKTQKKEIDDRLFPYSYSNVKYYWNHALIKACLDKKDKVTGRLVMHPHVLRKYFRTHAGCVIERDVVEALIGHNQGLDGTYRRYDNAEEILMEEYKKAEEKLLIFTDMERIEQSIKPRLQKQDTAISMIAQENIELKGEVEKLNETIQVLHTSMKNILGYEIQDEIDRRYAEEQEQLIRKEVEEELIKKQT